MDTIWEQIVTSLGGFAILIAAIAWLAKTLITHVLSKDIDKHKIDLDRETKLFEQQLKSHADTEIERFKFELQRESKEHEIRFTKLHEKRAEIISEFYEKLEEIYGNTALLALKLEKRPSQDHIIHARELWVKCGEVSRFFRKNRLYFSKKLADEIEKFLSIISEPSKTYVFSRLSETSDKDISKVLIEWSKKGRDAGRIKKLLEDEFRDLLGSGI